MTELLEREDLLAQLEAARVEGGRLLFVGGEAGVGKTSLVRAFTAAKPALHGSCENLATPTPFGPFLDVGVDIGGEPRQVAVALLRELERTPLLVLEDAHWADGATLDVLRVLGRRIDGTAALVLATYRDDEVDSEHPLRIVLGELASAAAVSRISVPRLSFDAVRKLAEPHGADGRAIHRLTCGNAFYVTEILAAAESSLPETVRDAVLARAKTLEPAARRLLDVVSVVPSRAELWLLEAVAGDLIERLGECLASGVLREEDDGIVFRHELARLAIESVVAPDRRRELHARILIALESGGDVARLAHHAEGAGDSAAVLRYAPEAARRAAAASAHLQAAAQYARALRHSSSLSSFERADLLAAHGRETSVTGNHDASIASRLEAIELYRQLEDPLREGDVWARLSLTYIAPGRNAEAERASTRSIELLEKFPPGRELANAYCTQAYMRMLSRDNAAGVEWGEKALTVAEALGDDDGVSQALNMIGTSHLMAGEIDRGIGYLLRSADLGRSLQDENRISSALGMLGSGLGEMYELELAEKFLHEHIAFSEERDFVTSYSQSWLAAVHVYRGRWDEGAALAKSLLADTAISRITALIALGRVRARRGDPGVAEVLDEALELAKPGGHLQRLGHVYAARAEAAWLTGDRERTVEEAHAGYPLAIEKRHLWFAGELAYWQWKASSLQEAPDWIAEPYRLQLEGRVREAADAWRARDCPYEAARALAESDDVELQLAALRELDLLGAGPAATALRRALQARGATVPRGPRPSTRANPGELTTRELDVLRLVAAGKRNADVAAELVLSPRTVDHHVSAILRKLQVRTRGEAAAAASELGLLLLQDR